MRGEGGGWGFGGLVKGGIVAILGLERGGGGRSGGVEGGGGGGWFQEWEAKGVEGGGGWV